MSVALAFQLYKLQPRLLLARPSKAPTQWGFVRVLILRALVLLLLLALFNNTLLVSSSLATEPPDPNFEWKHIEPGYSYGRYELGDPSAVVRPEVFLLRFDPKLFVFHVVEAARIERKNTDIRTLTRRLQGVAGINTHFFDKAGKPLGLLIVDHKIIQRPQFGGRLLGGVFSIRQDEIRIQNRDTFDLKGAASAIQAGPRLIDNGEALKILSSNETSRRSGIALTRKNEIILFATLLRYPGATFRDLQLMLLDPKLDVKDALNLDGGGSSQLFMEAIPGKVDEKFITGGDVIPVGLVVQRKMLDY